MTTMKAVRRHAFGGPELLAYEDAPRPEPQPGEILIQVAAVGINPIDWKIGVGLMEHPTPHVLPLIPGWEAAGTVAALGAGVSAFAVGDAVFAMTYGGTYAEYVAVPAEAASAKPAGVDFPTAAAIPLAATTAWQALHEEAGLTVGQTVLIHGGAGAVGGFAVQLAKIAGATVIATAAGDDLDYVRGLGANVVVDYKTEKFEKAAHGVDMVLDTVGGDTQARSWQTLRAGGVLVSTVGITTAPDAASESGVQGKALVSHADGKVLAEIAGRVDAGRLTPRVDSVHPLSEARQAQELAQSGRASGKVVLTV